MTKNLDKIRTIISARFFAAMAAGAATVARMTAIRGLVGNTALSIAEIASDPSNAGMAVIALLDASRVRKPKDFIDLGSARKAQTEAGVSKIGATFRKHDNSLVAKGARELPKGGR